MQKADIMPICNDSIDDRYNRFWFEACGVVDYKYYAWLFTSTIKCEETYESNELVIQYTDTNSNQKKL